MSQRKNITWNPIISYFEGQKRPLLCLISPFIQKLALEELLNRVSNIEDLQIITKWNASDVLSGVSDVSIYPFLKERDIPLFVNAEIHLKLSVFSSDIAFLATGNLTGKGLGLTPSQNIEIGSEVVLTQTDWFNIFSLFENSIRISDKEYEEVLKYIDENETTVKPSNEIIFGNDQVDSSLSKNSLPLTKSPDLLWDFYSGANSEADSIYEYVHDLYLYGILSENLNKKEFFKQLSNNFVTHPFVLELVALIRRTRSARWGLVRQWLTETCTDRPVPVRWELTSRTQNMYEWLSFFYEEISWDRPGYSQVIYWNR